MLGEALPIYSGGLGNVAGDQLKSASDLGVPVMGIGLLYQQGYFRQAIGADGSQLALYPINDPGQLPITPARDARANGYDFRSICPVCENLGARLAGSGGPSEIVFAGPERPGQSAYCERHHQPIIWRWPGVRLTQELVLGIGGWRLLRALGLNPRSLPSERRPCRLCHTGTSPRLYEIGGAAFRGGAQGDACR